jgi:hypothetical protein
MGILTKILGAAAQPAIEYFTRRQEIKAELEKQKRELDAAIHQKRLEQISKETDYENAWNLAQIQNSGWKDEWFTVLLSIPAVFAFVPKAVPHIQAGFIALNGMPGWYKAAFGVAVSAAFGYQKLNQAWEWWNRP